MGTPDHRRCSRAGFLWGRPSCHHTRGSWRGFLHNNRGTVKYPHFWTLFFRFYDYFEFSYIRILQGNAVVYQIPADSVDQNAVEVGRLSPSDYFGTKGVIRWLFYPRLIAWLIDWNNGEYLGCSRFQIHARVHCQTVLVILSKFIFVQFILFQFVFLFLVFEIFFFI